jgi:regulator of protease activity HflC (stomatin/prohibitin superfamily)
MFLMSALAIIVIALLIFLYYVYLGGDEMSFKGFLKIGTISVIAIAAVISSLVCLNRINPGEVGIVVDLFGSEKGVEQKELTVGMHWIAPWKDLYLFPIYEQNHQWRENEAFSFQTAEGLSVTADIGITFNLVPNRIPELFAKYRRGMEEITHLFIRNNIRDAINRAACKMRIDELYGPKKEDFFREVHSQVQAELEPLGFNISHLYIIGQFHVPETVMAALNKKIEAIQRSQQRENELKEAEAEARKEIAKSEGLARSRMISAKADADAVLLEAESKAKANALVNKSLTPELIQSDFVSKWNGQMPTVVSDKNMMMLNLGDKK